MSKPANTTTLAFSFTVQAGLPYQIKADRNRVGLYLANTTANTGFLSFGAEANTQGNSYPVTANETLPTWNNPDSCPKDYISFFSTAGMTFKAIITTQVEG